MTENVTASTRMRKWLGGLLVVVAAAPRCSSAAPAVSAAPAAAPRSSFGHNLSLAMSMGNIPAVGDTSVTAKFALTNNGTAAFDGCFGPSWGVSVIVEGGHDAGYLLRADRPGCVEKFALLPGQKISWSKKVPLSHLRSGTAKVTGWVKVVDPASCDPRNGCHETSIASPLMTMAIGER